MTKLDRIRAEESPEVLARLQKLANLGKRAFSNLDVVTNGAVSFEDVVRARQFLTDAIHETNPRSAWASLWEHYLIAIEMSKRIGEAARDRGVEVNPLEVELLTILHDVARLATHNFLRNDLLTDRLMATWGFPQTLMQKQQALKAFLETARDLALTTEQARFKEPMTADQEAKARAFFDSLSPTERILTFCDSVGKRGPQGLFDSEGYLEYLKGQETRYGQTSPWPSVSFGIKHREASTVLYAYVVEKTAQWLKDNGVPLDVIHDGLKEYGPRFVICMPRESDRAAAESAIKQSRFTIKHTVSDNVPGIAQTKSEDDLRNTARSLGVGEAMSFESDVSQLFAAFPQMQRHYPSLEGRLVATSIGIVIILDNKGEYFTSYAL